VAVLVEKRYHYSQPFLLIKRETMSFILFIQAVFLGIIEGLTEFLPISSTGHLIVAGEVINFTGELANSFDIVIQLGAILAVCWEYRTKISTVFKTLPTHYASRQLTFNLALGFLPAALMGFLFIKPIKLYLFNPFSVACALIIGGIIILLIEKTYHPTRVSSIEDIQPKDALKIGLAQCFALIPGTSRSGATIMGAMFFGIERKVATEFSFFLAIPIMFAATFFDIYKHWSIFTLHNLPVFIIGFLSAFLSALVAVRALLRFIAHHTFIAFAWYRIALGSLILFFIAI
jgi:undecaprenyl-diphosphatase